MAWLGLDCGGTTTRWAWWPAGARPGGSGAGVQPAVQGVDAAAAALVERLLAAVPRRDATAAVAAIAGAGDAAIRAALLGAVQRAGVAFPVAIVGDTLAAAAGALGDGPGLLVWSGTGSFAVARGPDGSLHRTGGRGHLLGDQGSGYDLVRRAAAAVVLAADGLGEPTALGDVLVRAFSAPSPQRLGAVLQRLSSGEVAAALPQVLACAAGDAVADEVLDDGMAALAMVANAAVRAAGLQWTGLTVTLGGGVLQMEPMRARLQQRLGAFGAAPARVAAADAGALGAARLAHDWQRRSEPMCRWVDDGAL
jgi:N-acetylglucosamine kinase-like BadF-type ATPase